MKRFYTYILLFIFFSCSNSNKDEIVFDSNVFPQHWELTGMSTGLSGDFLEGDDLPWRETILLEKDNRFVKTRLVDNQKNEAGGVFDFSIVNDEMYLVLNYDVETDLIESCGTENLVETLFMPSIISLIGGSAPCDGPGLFYERME
ncbi:hypothetical protein GTQ34_15605 [Muricauda sp. JGD-17]|uniref:Lipocalin-like domain-containing protein n=1 Tax=Flagellimonas ochracea TaxID=2696472 RepID=A0A964TFC1_9FLAO|nr:hypothetical protein [Allomuricauda ochracea]NAY93336.1 hypothetical protein [Allomuricauda ochracea]